MNARWSTARTHTSAAPAPRTTPKLYLLTWSDTARRGARTRGPEERLQLLQAEAGTWRETEETESCDDGEDDQHDEDRGPTTRRSEMDEWEEELEADIELERRELGQSPPEDHEDWAND